MQQKTTIFILTIIFSSLNLFSYELVRPTITEALTDTTIDRAAVTKLTITDSIKGDDYSPDSEWSLFKELDKYFINLEDVQILTPQNIPDADTIHYAALFY
jgi:hypothetical protein